MKFYDFVILTPDPDTFFNELAKHWGQAGWPAASNCFNGPGPSREIYRACRFGLLFREDNVINRVSCPTKLIEYLSSGLLPVLESSEIGDFRQMGMTFATIKEMKANELPQGTELADRVSQNFRVAETIAALSSRGLDTIARLLDEIFSGQQLVRATSQVGGDASKASKAYGSTPFILAVTIRPYMAAVGRPRPQIRREPGRKNVFLRGGPPC